jgi:hypothetical protein
VGGMVPAHYLALVFGEVPGDLLFPSFSSGTYIALVSITFATYFLFGMAGAMLAIFNIKADIRRAQYF